MLALGKFPKHSGKLKPLKYQMLYSLIGLFFCGMENAFD
jgi:hypothetical protein